jgi:RNA polymerase sigma factor for flagellar operon FliA
MMSLAQQNPAPQRVLTRADYDRFLPLVRRIAMRIARKVPRHISVNDLVGWGWVGLVEAFARTSEGMPDEELEAYATYRIKGAMLDYLRGSDPNARLIRNTSRRVTRAIARATKALGRAPEEHEIAEAMELTVQEYRDVLAQLAMNGMTRLEVVDVEELGSLDGPETWPDEQAGRKMLTDAVADAIRAMPERLQQVLALYYQEGCTLREIGSVLGVSESRVSQLTAEAMHHIRAAIGKE